MAKTWNNPIDKNVDWGGDESTGGLPVSGEQVQKFIKDSLNGKAGLFYYDTSNNRYLVFADEQDKDAYLADPTQTSLIVGSFDAPFNYTAEITLATPTYNAIFAGATGNYLDFTFDVKNKQGASTGENVVITYTFIRNATRQTFSQVARHGESIHINIDKYLGEGVNTVIIGVTGQSTLAATTASVTYQVVNLQLTDEMDISAVYDLTSGAKTMEVPFTVKGAGIKTVEWYLDNVQLDFVKNEDEIVEVEAQRVKMIELANLQQGRHSLQIRAYTTINGEKFYTPTLYRDVIVYTGVNADTIVGIAMDIPVQYGLAGASPTLYGITQYIPYTLRFATYSPSNKLDLQVTIAMAGEVLGTVASNNGKENAFSVVAKTAGNKMISLTSESVAYQLPVIVAPTTMDIEEITSGLKLDFSAIGKNNNSSDKDSWAFGDYTGTFTGFNWNAGSGWVNNRLYINDGASFAINYAPLSGSPVNLGRTLEFEFKTTNVNDDDAVICDLRNAQGAGLLITATKVSLRSENGVLMENEFKADENVRIGIVIHRSASSSRKGLSFIYANGTVSRCVNWESADNYASDAQIEFIGSAGAEVELKAIRVYEAALTDDNMLNNFILYRDTVAEMQEVYDRNNVYAEGSTTFSPDKMVSRLPVMLVTGDIPTLENTSDKDTQIIVDIDYTDMQDPSRSFKMVGAAMRPQGTSSMGYPKKNFRIYTREVANTVVYDAEGKVIADKLYSFKKNAIPVDCWCLKADYAESSGTHNTGVARMWNNALYNMQIDGEYVCRTKAQKAALANGYPYDVRTTIDGFPVLMFYRKNATDEPIFIGKYNFNNDKSTEKVFGFTDIPGFNNDKMQCWEVLNNGNPLALFQTVDGFDSGWKEAYESRYPDTKTPDTSMLKAFSTWMVGIAGNHERFATEKWQHFNIYMMAAYYCYLMRHAAADQLVKNAMFTTEDGQYWYYILYDNDTINGLNNLGEIDLLPTDDRNSVDASGQYKFAGHSSVLWNMFEADEEFMQIVKDVDNALYSAGISYNECIRTFDEEQAAKWVERVYNQDSEYKYVGPFVNNGINNLEMLQGKRDLHRRWWLSKRFSIYDAKFVSGEYKSQAIELKCMNDTPAGQSFVVTAGYPLDYGYGINDVPRVTGVTLAPGESHTFATSETVNLGDPIRIYGAPNISELNLSPMAHRLSVINVANACTESLGTRLEKLVIGDEGVNNVEVSEISGLKMLKKLTHLDIRGMKGIKALDLTSQPYFEKLSAIGSEIASVSFAKGAPVTRLELPTTMKSLNLEQLPYLTSINLVLADITGIHTINVKGCPSLANEFTWISRWYSQKATTDSKCTLIMDNVNWTGVNADDLVEIGRIGNLDLKGKVIVTDITEAQVNALMDVFGTTAFDKKSDFYIDAPDAIFISGRTELLEGESEQYTCVVFGGEVRSVRWSISSSDKSGVAIDAKTGVLTTSDGSGGKTITIKASAITDNGVKTKEADIAIMDAIYPSKNETTITGDSQLEQEYQTYVCENTTQNVNVLYSVSWELTGLEDYAAISSTDGFTCTLRKLRETIAPIEGVLACIFRTANGVELFRAEKPIRMVNENVAESDPAICKALYNAGLCANEAYITKDEAALVTEIPDVQNAYIGAKSFNGFKYFTSVTSIDSIFKYSNLESIELPESLEIINGTFYGCSKLREIVIPAKVIIIASAAFAGCSNLSKISCLCAVAPNAGSAFYDLNVESGLYTGRNTYNTGENRLYIPSNGMGYDSGGWLDPLQNAEKCGFTLSATLPEAESPIAETDAGICMALYSAGLCADPAYVTKEEAALITADDLKKTSAQDGSIFKPYVEHIKSFNGFKYFTAVTKVATGTFFQLHQLESICLPPNCKTLELGAFNQATKLSHIELPDALESIGDYCFYKVPATEFNWPNNLKTIGNYAFQYSGVTNCLLPDGFTTLGTYAFSYCQEIKTIQIPAQVAAIPNYCFEWCHKCDTIISKAMTAPSVPNQSCFGGSEVATNALVGGSVKAAGKNTLYVPSGATGYDAGFWASQVCNAEKCGFTLSATL